MNIFEIFKKRKCVCQNKYKLRYNEEIKQWECYCQSGIDDGHGNCYCANNQYWDSQETVQKAKFILKDFTRHVSPYDSRNYPHSLQWFKMRKAH